MLPAPSPRREAGLVRGMKKNQDPQLEGPAGEQYRLVMHPHGCIWPPNGGLGCCVPPSFALRSDSNARNATANGCQAGYRVANAGLVGLVSGRRLRRSLGMRAGGSGRGWGARLW
jgi:hypothetical protein